MVQLKICAVLFSLLLAVLSVSALPFLPASSSGERISTNTPPELFIHLSPLFVMFPAMNSEEKREGRLDALILAPGSHAASFAQNSHSGKRITGSLIVVPISP